jgi:hypothetical protein
VFQDCFLDNITKWILELEGGYGFPYEDKSFWQGTKTACNTAAANTAACSCTSFPPKKRAPPPRGRPQTY